MDALTLIVTNAVTLVTGLGGSILYFRPKLKSARAEASMKETEAENFQYESLISRINSMEKMYNEQLSSQNDLISELRTKILKLTEEKFASDQRIVQLEGQNNILRERVNELENEIKSRAFK